MGDISKILLGALIALSTSVVGHVFVARQNDLSQRIDELVKFILEYAELSSDYWANEHDAKEIKILEAKIAAKDYFIGAMLASISSANAHYSGWQNIERSLIVLANTATGGSFQVANRKADLERASQVYSDATMLCVSLREARQKLIKIPFLNFYYNLTRG